MKNGEKRRKSKIIKDKPVKIAIFGVLQRSTVMVYYTHNGRPLYNFGQPLPSKRQAQKRKNGGYYEKHNKRY